MPDRGHTRHPSAPPPRNQIKLPTAEGPVAEVVDNPRARSEVARYWNAVHRYLETGDDRRLRGFETKTVVLADGRRFPFITDLATLDRLAEGGVLAFEFYGRR
jgi:hypothetical protein